MARTLWAWSILPNRKAQWPCTSAVTDYHKLRGSEQHEFIILRSEVLKLMYWQSCLPSGDSRQDEILDSSPCLLLLEATWIPWLICHPFLHHQSQQHSIFKSLGLSLWPLFLSPCLPISDLCFHLSLSLTYASAITSLWFCHLLLIRTLVISLGLPR